MGKWGFGGAYEAGMPKKKNTPSSRETITTAPVRPGVEWLRPSDVRRTHGIGRSLLYELIREGSIRTVCLRRQGRRNGMRLISAQSLNEFIEGFEEGSK
jgi:hypothetical protein